MAPASTNGSIVTTAGLRSLRSTTGYPTQSQVPEAAITTITTITTIIITPSITLRRTSIHGRSTRLSAATAVKRIVVRHMVAGDYVTALFLGDILPADDMYMINDDVE